MNRESKGLIDRNDACQSKAFKKGDSKEIKAPPLCGCQGNMSASHTNKTVYSLLRRVRVPSLNQPKTVQNGSLV